MDNYRHKGLRKKLVNDLRKKGITNEQILEVINEVPRHLFIDHAFADWAYKDVPFKIDAEQTISQPYTVAFMTNLLDIKPGDKVLEIGTGSGYQATILSKLGAKVYTIERQTTLFKKTSRLLEELGYNNIRFLYGDGYAGYERFAPYDKIIVTAGAPYIPKALIDQLCEGGLMVIPVNVDHENQEMTLISKGSAGQVKKSTHGLFRFVPMLPGMNE